MLRVLAVFSFFALVFSRICDQSSLKALIGKEYTVSERGKLWSLSVHHKEPKIKILVYNLVRTRDGTAELCKNFLPSDKDEYNLTNTGLVDIEPEAFPKKNPDYTIDLSFNFLSKIRSGVFSHTNIHGLNLSYNKIVVIEKGAFNSMPKLEILDLSNNEISKWSGEQFKDSPNLRHVYLRENIISELPAHVLQNHQCGYLSSMNFSLTFRNIFQYIEHLGYCSIDFSRNRISTVHPEAFVGKERFGDIDLSDNLIQEISPVWLRDFKMVRIIMKQNKLKVVPFEVINTIKMCLLCIVDF